MALGGGALAGAPFPPVAFGGGAGFDIGGEFEGGGADGCEAFAGGAESAGGTVSPGAGGVGCAGGFAGVACLGTVGGAVGVALCTATRTFSTSEVTSSSEKLALAELVTSTFAPSPASTSTLWARNWELNARWI